ncbi:homeobox-domain-containing protein [Punctularia strigosozonata HHB-11173 SS5]|uniref:Homeobox-domain-containing protein n=1 Tax=Punctularia strigosozonata (strain HHB-11173) TaxID=741275 RepID=R7S3J3_PUNST|nr:homeobox-domain-containing protein [Punctularia strigosozonata HHB-11173 SS5]EIN04980.1 homeobox-domain-containing protein [Punctularia strigosozonata HHB-11173 SS5]
MQVANPQQTAPRPPPLRVDLRRSLRTAADPSSPSPSPAPASDAYPSPLTATSATTATTAHTDADADDLDPSSSYRLARESETGPSRHRRGRSSTASGSSSPVLEKQQKGEKRKRSRVTPEQLAHLERFFAADRSPTAARRKEISDLLGMQERQTQIWFQNRRAKAKSLDGKPPASVTPPDTPPALASGYEPDLHYILHEDQDITIIPCHSLTIGTWRRISTPESNRRDLVAYLCEAKSCLTWFIRSAGFGFKMEIAFDSVLNAAFANTTPGRGVASFALSRPPAFFMETTAAIDSDTPAARTWKRCADWTEDRQATRALTHELAGPAMQLAHILRNFEASAHGAEVRLTAPPAYAYAAPPSPASSERSLFAPYAQQQQQQPQQQQQRHHVSSSHRLDPMLARYSAASYPPDLQLGPHAMPPPPPLSPYAVVEADRRSTPSVSPVAGYFDPRVSATPAPYPPPPPSPVYPSSTSSSSYGGAVPSPALISGMPGLPYHAHTHRLPESGPRLS